MGNESSYNGIVQGLSFSLCLYSAYNQGTWPSWLPLETAAIQITNKNNGIKSEYVIQAILPQGKYNPPAARGEGGEEEIFPMGRSSHGCCPWDFLDPSLKCLVLYSSLWETGYWARWTSNLIHHGNSYDPIESPWIIQIFCKKIPHTSWKLTGVSKRKDHITSLQPSHHHYLCVYLTVYGCLPVKTRCN